MIKGITETFLDNGNEGVVQKRSIDVKPILENNKSYIIKMMAIVLTRD